jgi:hypothetical protein
MLDKNGDMFVISFQDIVKKILRIAFVALEIR